MAFERFEVLSIEDALAKYTSSLFRPSVAARLMTLLDSFSETAKTAVVERDYIDIDYSASYHDQRGRSFTPTLHGTTRIHFFTEQFTKRAIVGAGNRTVRKMIFSYLGFTVVRPDRPTTLGRTFLSCPPNVSGKPAGFPPRGTILVDLAGIPLTIESCPYMSQDRKIMACATTALWMSSTPLVDKIPGVASHSTSEITGMAMSLNRPYGPAIGRRGLTLPEMEQAFLEIGFDPRVYTYPTPAQLVEICHLFSDSGIPLVLYIESNGIGHAVTVIGYTLKAPDAPEASIPGIFRAHQFVADLIIHDDEGECICSPK